MKTATVSPTTNKYNLGHTVLVALKANMNLLYT